MTHPSQSGAPTRPQPLWFQLHPHTFRHLSGSAPAHISIFNSEDQNGTTTANSSTPKRTPRGAGRCRRRNLANGRCRLPVQDPATGLCFRHADRVGKTTYAVADVADLSVELFGESVPTFQSAEEINSTLCHLVVLLAQGRISSRRAAVITHARSLILCGVLVIDRKASDAPVKLEWSGPWRPNCVIQAEAARNSSAGSNPNHASNSSSNEDAKPPVMNRNSKDTTQHALSLPQPSQYNPSLSVEEENRHGHR